MPKPIRLLIQTGITEDGRQVIDFFKLVETRGMPLDVVLDLLKEANFVPDWCSFVKHSIDCNWNLKNTIYKMEVAIIDIYGTEYLKHWKYKMSLHVEKLNG